MLTALSGRPLGRDLNRRLGQLLAVIATVVLVVEAAIGLQLHQSPRHLPAQGSSSIGEVGAQFAGPHTHRPLNPPSSNRRVEDASSGEAAADTQAESPVAEAAVLVVTLLLVAAAATVGASQLTRPAFEERIVSRGHLLRAPPVVR